MSAPLQAPSYTQRAVMGLALTLLGAFVVLGGTWLLVQPHFRPDYQYTQPVVQPPRSTFCPGDQFDVTYHIRINRVPAVIGIINTFYSDDLPGTVVFDNTIEWTVHTVPTTVKRTLTVTVPRLTPGRWEFRQGAQSLDAPPSAFAVPFVIPRDCLNK